MCSASNLFRRGSGSNFFQDNPLSVAFKRRAKGIKRRRCSVEEEPRAAPHVRNQPIIPPASPSEPAEQDAVATPETPQPSVDASSPTADSPDSCSDPDKSAIDSDTSPPDKLPNPPPYNAEDVHPDVSPETDPNPPLNAPAPGPICAICHEPTGIPRSDLGEAGKIEKMAMLPCGHKFGHLCLLQWIDQDFGQSCPLCRDRAVHPVCMHYVLPALVEGGPASLGEGGKLSPKCESCSFPCNEGNQLVRYERRMEEARGVALVSLSQVPREWTPGMVQREWLRMDETARKVTTPWDVEMESAWLRSQRGRDAW